MKKLAFPLIVSAVMSASQIVAQTTVATDPVGFISETVTGAVNSAPQYTFVSPTLTNPIVFQGTIASITATTITVNGASWTSGQFNGTNGPFYVEVFNATNPGALADVTGTSTNSVTVDSNLTSFASAGDSIRIRAHVTLGQFLGANNTFGLQAGTDSTTADQVIVYDGGSETTYFYYPGDGTAPAEWMDAGFNSYPGGSNNVTIAPFQGIIIKRIAAGNVTITSVGSVKTGNTLFPILPGNNIVGTVSAQGLTLGTSGLYQSNGSALQPSSTGVNADEVIIFTGSTSTTYIYYPGDGTAPAEWMDSGFNSYPTGSNNVPIPAGTSFVVVRRNGGGFNWTLPSPTSF